MRAEKIMHAFGFLVLVFLAFNIVSASLALAGSAGVSAEKSNDLLYEKSCPRDPLVQDSVDDLENQVERGSPQRSLKHQVIADLGVEIELEFPPVLMMLLFLVIILFVVVVAVCVQYQFYSFLFKV